MAHSVQLTHIMKRTTGLVLLLAGVACTAENQPGTSEDAYLTEGAWGEQHLVAEAPGRDAVDREVIDLAVASDGTVHRAYVNESQELEHESRAPGATGWDRNVVDRGDVGEYASIAVDASGVAHIAYFDAANADLKYARGKGDAWSTVTVAGEESSSGSGTDIAVDANGRVHVCYKHGTTDQLGYATSTDGESWEAGDLAAGGQACRLALGADGAVYVSHYEYASRQLHLASLEGGAWNHEDVPGGGSFRSSPVVTPDGSLHMIIAPRDEETLAHLTKRDGAWSEPVEIGAGYSSSAAVDADGVVHLITVAWSQYLRYYQLGADGWESETVPHGSTLARYPELAIHNGQVHVAYRDNNFYDFYFLTRK